MGISVNMNVDEVYIKKDKIGEAVKILKELNIEWKKNNDWCRFNCSEDIIEIIENIGFSCFREDNGDIYIEDFEYENLGDHENMFEKLAPTLRDCTITFYTDIDADFKVVIKDGKSESIKREPF